MLDTRPKIFIFVLMPFDETFNDIYELGIKAACYEAGAYCERVDEQIFQESILDRIYNQISKADLIISDMTGRNPNVFYETGYAHALGKKVILLTQRQEDIPFDLKHYPHIVYGGKIVTLKSDLMRNVKWYIENPSAPTFDPLNILEYFSFGHKIEKETEILVPSISIFGILLDDHLEFDFEFSVHNTSSNVVDAQELSISLIVPGVMTTVYTKDYGKLPDGKNNINLGNLKRFLPDEWYPQRIRLSIDVDNNDEIMYQYTKCHFVLRVLGPMKSLQIPFTCSLESISHLG